MTLRFRRVVLILFFTIVLFFQAIPVAMAAPRDPGDRGRPSILKIIKRFFGIKALEELPLPPRP